MKRPSNRVAEGSVALLVALVAACSSSGGTTGDDGSSGSVGGDAGASDATSAADTSSASTDASSGADAASFRDSAVSDGASQTDAGATTYDHDGPVTYTTTNENVTNGNSSFTEIVYMPSTTGTHPLVSISPGLQQPAAAYAPYAMRLASYGVAVLLRDDPGAFTDTSSVVDDLTYVISTWAPTALAGKIDVAHVGLAGHSRGGQATLLAAENGLKGKVAAWFGLDPVDTSPSGSGPTARGSVGTIGIPTTYLGAGVSTTCSPAADNYEVLYAASSTPSVQITANDANHVEFELPASCVVCGLCTPAGTADAAAVLAYSVRYMTAAFARDLLGDASVGAAFQGAGAAADVSLNRVAIVSK